jgi:hypothetical protein
MRLHSGLETVVGDGELDGAPAAFRRGGSVLLGVAVDTGVTVLAHGGGAEGWASLLRAVGPRGRVRKGEPTPAGALARALGERRAAVTVLLGAESALAVAATHGAAESIAAHWRAEFEVAVAVDPVSTDSVRLIRRARRLGLAVVLVGRSVAPTSGTAESAGLTIDAAETVRPVTVPADALRLLLRQRAERAGGDARQILHATARLVSRCRVDPAADLGWGAPPPAAPSTGAELGGIELSDIEHRIDGATVAVQHERFDEALDALRERFPGAALLPGEGIVLDGDRVPIRGRRRGVPVSAFDRRACSELGLATIEVVPDRALSALAHARTQAGGSTLSATGLTALFPAAMTAGALEHAVPVPAPAVPVLPGCVIASGRAYRVEADAVRAPLRSVAGLTAAEVERILAARPFRSIDDFAARAAPARERLLRLAAEGALDALLPGAARAAVLSTVRALGSEPAPSDEPTLFAGLDIPLPPPPPPPHAIESFRPMLDELQVVSAGDLAGSRPGAEVLVAGLRVAGDRAPRGSARLSVRLEDGSGIADCAFPSAAKGAVGSLLAGTRLVLVQGRTCETDDDRITIEAENAWDLKRMWSDWTASRRRSA